MKVEGMQRKYLLSMNEFAILANRCGIERIFGYVDCSQEQMTKELLIQTLHQLTKKGMMTISETGVSVKEPYQSYFQSIKNSKEAIVIDTDQSIYPGKCCYLSADDSVIITESSDTREDTLRIYPIKKEELVDCILEEGYLTYDTENVDYRRRHEMRILTRLQWWDLEREVLIREVHFCLQDAQCFIEQGLGEQMVRLDYDSLILRKLLQDMIGGDDNASGGLICSVIK